MSIWSTGFGANGTHAPSEFQTTTNDKTTFRVRSIIAPTSQPICIRHIACKQLTDAGALGASDGGYYVYRGQALDPEAFAQVIANQYATRGWVDPSGYQLVYAGGRWTGEFSVARFSPDDLVAAPGEGLFVVAGLLFNGTSFVSTQTQFSVLGHTLGASPNVNIKLR